MIETNPLKIPKICEVPFAEKKLLINISYNKISDHPTELYSERLKSIRYFEKAFPDQFDLYGFGWDKLNPGELAFISYKGPVDNKWDVLPRYKFALCYENNYNQLGYITEKIFDCLRADCVPIYWGAPNIHEYVDAGCFIDRRNFESNKDLEKYITQITEDDYKKFREAKKEYLLSDRFKQFTSDAFAQNFINILKLN